MREINPKETTRAYAFEMWMQAPMPMVTFFKALFTYLVYTLNCLLMFLVVFIIACFIVVTMIA